MRIATYNVWNENKGVGNRFNQLIEEIRTINADVIALQEITQSFFDNFLVEESGYKYCEFRQYRDENEGLAILSKYPFKHCYFLNTSEEYNYSAALNVIFEVGDLRFSFTNIHLPWASAIVKEKQIVAIDKYIHLQEKNDEADFFIMLGDYNGEYNSSIHRYLLGEQTIDGNESNRYWYELISVYCELNHLPIPPTLDFPNNPRWAGSNTRTIYSPSTVDRIYMMDNWNDVKLNNVETFGKSISPQTGLCPSDHYGVYADIDFAK